MGNSTKREIITDDSQSELDAREATENEFYCLMAQAQEVIAAFKEKDHQGDEFFSQSSRQRGGAKNVKLPQLRLPPFDGKTDKWLEFRDLYLSLIHDNENIDDLAKECDSQTIAQIIKHDFYMDDLLTGAQTEAELGNICESVTNILNGACLPLPSWGANEGIKFVFSPAYSPHFGGIWEAGVKSAKFHMARVLGNTHMTFEELSTLFNQIEAILNSRPLTYLSTDPNDLEPLTPGHFLIGQSLMSLPSPNLLDINPNRLSRYEHIEQMRQQFWNRWHKEFLAELQERIKWKVDTQQLQVNDVVVVKETNVPPMKWRMGRIVKLFPGQDNVSRVADVGTARGIIRRAVHRLCPLPKPEEAFFVLEALPPRGGGAC
ncbi:uncharacterized protein LOC134750371 [Cydia strobilella]|uniref:uncharacterized protein LOC134750371 n=1 Tax=Cydia strobilella TaxID=1100964 RepID=UPI0030042EA7